MYESLTRKDKTVMSIIQPLENKIDKIEKSISILIESKTENSDNKITFDLSNLIRENNIESLETLQEKIYQLLYDIRIYHYWLIDEENTGQRVYFNKRFNLELTQNWLDSLKTLVQSFKWSKKIHCEEVFKDFPLSKYNKWHNEIEYKTLFELYSIYNSLAVEDKSRLVNTVCQELNKNYDKSESQKKSLVEESAEDLPF